MTFSGGWIIFIAFCWWLVIHFCDKSSGGPYWTLYRRKRVIVGVSVRVCRFVNALKLHWKKVRHRQGHWSNFAANRQEVKASWKAKHAVKRSPTSFAPTKPGTWRERMTSLFKNWHVTCVFFIMNESACEFILRVKRSWEFNHRGTTYNRAPYNPQDSFFGVFLVETMKYQAS